MDVNYYRDIGDTYAKIALESTNPAASAGNAAEASKYYTIADRLERVPEPAGTAAAADRG